MDCSPPGPSLHGIPRQEYWSGLPFPSAGELPHSGIRPTFPALAGRFFITELSGKPKHWGHGSEETNNGISFCRQTVHVIIRKLSCQCDFPGSASAKESACQSRRHETWIRSLGREEPLEKEMATHSNILAWKLPWTEEPGGLQSMGSQRVGHN